MKNGIKVAEFQVEEAFINKNGRPRPVPQEVIDELNKLNTKGQKSLI